MVQDNKQSIRSGRGSRNYQAGRDLSIHHGNIIQTLARSRIAQVAAVMATLASIVTVLQYLGTLPANFQLMNPTLRFNYANISAGDPKVSFRFAFVNMGPDDIRNMKWFAWLDGIEVDIRSAVNGTASLVAKGDNYYADRLTSPEILSKLDFKSVSLAKRANVCMVFAGKVPGTIQWMLLSAELRGIVPDLLTNLGLTLKVAATGGGIAVGDASCKEK